MNPLDVQADYWDLVAPEKTFRHPVPMERMKELLQDTARILDYGCGYGRVVSELAAAGFCRVTGVDVSRGMITRGKALDTSLDLRQFDGGALPFARDTFDCCLLMAVLTSIPTDDGQRRVIEDLHRVMKPGGIILVSDFPLQNDRRNRERYGTWADEFGLYGVFRLPDGGVMRHHDMGWVRELISGFTIMDEQGFRIVTMNGHDADAFRILAKK
jgi:SAM-dependent methyltransferase